MPYPVINASRNAPGSTESRFLSADDRGYPPERGQDNQN